MRITILALGSRGDVQPFVALALSLCARGHSVRIAAPEDYAPLVRDYGVEFAVLGGLIREQMDMPRVAAMLDGAGNPLRFAAETLPQVMPLVDRLVEDASAAGRDADALLVSTLGAYPGLHVAEKRGVPLLTAHFHPLAQTSDEQHVNFPALPPWLPLRSRYNRLSHFLGAQGLWQFLRPALNRARARILGLRPLSPAALVRRVRALDHAAVYGYSTLLAPLPESAAAGGRREGRPAPPVTGFWFLPHRDGWQPAAQLKRFLEAGPPPIYVGFGSNLTGREPHRLTELYVNAIERIGARGIFFAGWGDFASIPLPHSILRVESVPHDWLFERMAAVVHHGGAGSTSAAAAAGVPAVAMPFLGDQFFWARQIQALGCGPAPLDRKTLSVEHLAETLADLMNNGAYRRKAQALGARLRAESGAGKAAEWMEQQITCSGPAAARLPGQTN